jgi:hypothetical protein
MAISTFDGWVGEVLLRAGDEYSDDHPLVKDRPEMFDVEQGPEDDAFPGPSVSGPSTPEAPARKKPGPKPGTPRTKRET